MRFYKHWTHQEDETLEAMRMEGYHSPKIANALKRPISSVKNRIYRLGLGLPQIRLLQYEVYLCKPHIISEVAKKLGVKSCTVKAMKRKLQNYGIEVAKAIRTTQFEKKI